MKDIKRELFLLMSLFCFVLLGGFLGAASAKEEEPAPLKAPLSPQTTVCLGCHQHFTPGIVEDWRTSRHATITPEVAFKKPALERRISSDAIPEDLRSVAVGCYECHGQHPSLHQDSFEHFGFQVHVVVSPNNCKTCHAVEVEQYSESKKAHALANLQKNPLYQTLVEAITSVKVIKDDKVVHLQASEQTKSETCYACHGTMVTVSGMKKVSTSAGDLEVPDLTNWPNQGVGRVNPDGSLGACTACHPRHSFALEIARKPYTCAQCHLEPDVPAWNVYGESKHGNIFFAKQREWNWGHVPWRVGRDVRAPTCATCHNSLLATPEGEVLVPRTHDFGARLWVRLFGLIYAHPQPGSGKTYLIKNKDALPLPTMFTGEPASEFLIDGPEQRRRQTEMKKVCQSCHSSDWTNQHFAKLDATVAETDRMTLAATQLLLKAWKKGLADASNPFDEEIEQLWIKQWLFYANSVRYASAMSGPDYATFKNGWWGLTTLLQEMQTLVK